jgi:hypothetical protein
VNKEDCKFLDSAVGKKWKEKGKDYAPFATLLNGNKRTGNEPVTMSYIHHVLDMNEKSVVDGMVQCYIQHKNNTNAPHDPQMTTKAMPVRVLVDNGSLGEATSYVDETVAERLEELGYQRKISKKDRVVIHVNNFNKLNEYFKVKLTLKNPETKEWTTKTVVTYVIKLTRTKNDPEIIIGLNDIRRHDIYKAIIIEMMKRAPITNEDDESSDDDNDDDDEEFIPPHDGLEEGESNDCPFQEEPGPPPEKRKTGTDESLKKTVVSWDMIPVEERLNIKMIENDDELSIEDTLRVCRQVARVFSKSLRKESARITPMMVEVTPEWVSKENQQPPRQVSRLKDEEIAKQVATMIDAEIVEASRANAHSQVTLAMKPDGTWRFCIDYRRLNAVTKDDCKWPLPRIDAMLQRLGSKKSKYFAILDLTKGYYQAPLHKDCRHLTAFITQKGVYEWNRVAMGLRGAPSFFQRAMATEVLPDLIYNICEVYLDDIIVFGRTKEEYLKNLETVLKRLDEFNVTVNPNKCKLGLREVEYVGHVINEDGMTFSPEKLRKAMSIDRPKTERQLKSFLGVANYFRDHIMNHSMIVAPLHDMMEGYRPRRELIWTKEGEEAFERVKKLLCDCPTLFWIDETAPVHLYTDASKLGVGAYLCQERNGKQVPIRFFSKSLNKGQRKWDVPRLEAYAIYAAFKEFDYLLRDAFTHIYTDHKNLTFIRDSTNEVVIRWKLSLQCYRFTIQHVRGEDNPIADFWSRLEEAPIDEYDLMKDNANGNHVVANMLQYIRPEDVCEEEEDDKYFDELMDREIKTLWEKLNFHTNDNIEVDEDKRKIILTVHNSIVGHHGVDRTIDLLKEKNHGWEKMEEDVRKVIKCCGTCQKMDARRVHIEVDHYTVGKYRLFDRLNIDTIGPYPMTEEGYDHIVVIVDSFSRYMTLFPTKGIDGDQAVNALLWHIGHYGAPNEILSDGGPEYANELIKEVLNTVGIEHLLTIAYSKEENSIVERANKEVNRWVRDILYDKRLQDTEWIYYMPFIQRIHNATNIKSIGTTPAKLVFGDRMDLNRNFITPTTLMEDENQTLVEWGSNRLRYQDQVVCVAQSIMKKHEEEIKESNIKKRKEREKTKFAVGEQVLLSAPPSMNGRRRKNKLEVLHTGPYEVVNNDGNHYLIRDLITHVTKEVGIWRLRPYYQIQDSITPEEVAMHDHIKEYDVACVLGHTGTFKRKQNMKFKIRWDGEYNKEEYDTEEPWENVRKSSVVHDYLRTIGEEKHIPKETEHEKNTTSQFNKKRRRWFSG